MSFVRMKPPAGVTVGLGADKNLYYVGPDGYANVDSGSVTKLTGEGWARSDYVAPPDGPAYEPVMASKNLTGRVEISQKGQWQATYQKLRAQIISRVRESDEIVSGATITLGASNAASTIASAVAIAKDSPLITHSCRVEVGSSWPNSQYVYPRTKDSQAPGTAAAYTDGSVASHYLETNAAVIEFGIKGSGIEQSGRIWVTEFGVRKLLGVVPTVPSDGAKYLVKVDTGASRWRVWEIELANGYFSGFLLGPSDLYGPHILQGLNIIVPGDSYTEGTGTTNGVFRLDGFANRLCRLLGAEKRVISGIGGTGYAATNLGEKKSLLERLQMDVIDLAPDIVIHTNGINDTLDGINTNAPLVFDAISAALPNCVQIVFGPFQPRSIDVEAKRAALQSICAARGLLFIDNVTGAEITGTGYQSSPQRNGNSDIVIGGDTGSDVTHPTVHGHHYIADWRFKALCRTIGI